MNCSVLTLQWGSVEIVFEYPATASGVFHCFGQQSDFSLATSYYLCCQGLAREESMNEIMISSSHTSCLLALCKGVHEYDLLAHISLF